MATLKRIDPEAFGAIGGTVLLISWLIYIVVTVYVPYLYPESSNSLVALQWPSIVTSTNTLLYDYVPSLPTLSSIYGNVPLIPIYGIISSVIFGLIGGFLFAKLYNILAEHFIEGIEIDIADQGKMVDRIGAVSGGVAWAGVTLMFAGIGVVIVAAASTVLSQIYPISSVHTVVRGVEVAVFLTGAAFIAGIVFLFAFNFASGIAGGVVVALERDRDMFVLRRIGVFSFARLLWILSPLSQLTDFTIRDIIHGGALSIATEQYVLVYSCIFGVVISFAVALLYDYVITRVAALRIDLQGVEGYDDYERDVVMRGVLPQHAGETDWYMASDEDRKGGAPPTGNL